MACAQKVASKSNLLIEKIEHQQKISPTDKNSRPKLMFNQQFMQIVADGLSTCHYLLRLLLLRERRILELSS